VSLQASTVAELYVIAKQCNGMHFTFHWQKGAALMQNCNAAAN